MALLSTLLIAAAPLVVFTPKAGAAFNSSRIIDDNVFSSANSMSAGTIDTFLNSFSNSCISQNHGFSAPDPTGYSPGGGYTYGGNVSAGTIIAHAAQAYDINPQVLLTTLQKEQGLVSGDLGCSVLRYTGAVGYGCPDSGTTHDYSGLNLYTINGVTTTSVTGTCVNSPSKAGFSQQLIRGAWLLKFGQQRSLGNISWAIVRGSWNNSDDPQSCYSGPMTPGPRKRCPSDVVTSYDGYTTIDGTATYMSTGATASLYWYTPHFHGNQVFYDTYTKWFGSTLAPQSSQSLYSRSGCNIPAYDSSRVGRLYNPDINDYFYTTNPSEACVAVRFGYIWDGIVMQNIVSTAPGAIPIYRLASPGHHVFTTSIPLKDQYTSNGYTYEGIAFFGYSSPTAGTIPAYNLTSDTASLFTSAGIEKNYYVQYYSFTNNGIAFYTPSMTSTVNVYRLVRGSHRLYTTNAAERDAAVKTYGFTSETDTFSDKSYPDTDTLPVYRLSSPQNHFYTTSRTERDAAVVTYGYMSEGVEFYGIDYTTPDARPIYRITDWTGSRVYTPNGIEKAVAVSRYNYQDEGVNFYGF
ncbi:MAG TPA: hypothetical protein VLI54_02800 [Bacillota bacterium]|nr:hypothetical protein [Bacillota bacterium]